LSDITCFKRVLHKHCLFGSPEPIETLNEGLFIILQTNDGSTIMAVNVTVREPEAGTAKVEFYDNSGEVIAEKEVSKCHQL